MKGHGMRCFSISIVLILVIISSAFAQSDKVVPDKRGYIVKVGDSVADFSVTLTDGTEKMLSEFKSDVIVLNFFASWCKVCRKEIPHIEKEVWQKFKDKNVLVLGVDFKEETEKVVNFINEMKITYPVALDPSGAIFAKFAQGGVTRNVVLDKDLNIIFLTRLFRKQELILL